MTTFEQALAEALHGAYAAALCISDLELHHWDRCDAKRFWTGDAERILAAHPALAKMAQLADIGAAVERLSAEAESMGCGWNTGRDMPREGHQFYADLVRGSYFPADSLIEAIDGCIAHTRSHAAALGEPDVTPRPLTGRR